MLLDDTGLEVLRSSMLKSTSYRVYRFTWISIVLYMDLYGFVFVLGDFAWFLSGNGFGNFVGCQKARTVRKGYGPTAPRVWNRDRIHRQDGLATHVDVWG